LKPRREEEKMVYEIFWLAIGVTIGVGAFAMATFSLAHIFKNLDDEAKTPQPKTSVESDEHLSHIIDHPDLVIDEDVELGKILPFPHPQKWRENRKG